MMTETTRSLPPSAVDDALINTFSVSGKAVIDWKIPGADRQTLLHPDPKNKHIIFEACLENSPSQPLSFFRLRVPVVHKHLHGITVYIHIPPDHISSLDWNLQYEAADSVRTRLNCDITRLRFNLHRPVQVIVPDRGILRPKRPLTASIFKALESLATALDVTVYLEHTTLSKARLQSVAEVIRSHLSRPIPRYCDLHRLYEGVGGKSLLPDGENDVSTASEVASPASVDSPPAYDEIGPGPPMPPLLAEPSKRQEKRHRQSSGSSTHSVGSPSTRPIKRGLWDSDAGVAGTVPDKADPLPVWARSAFAELAELRNIVVKQNETIAALQEEVVKLRDQAKTGQDSLISLEQRLEKTDVAVADLDDAIIEHGDLLADLEGHVTVLQESRDESMSRRGSELERVRDELRVEIMTRFRSALESP